MSWGLVQNSLILSVCASLLATVSGVVVALAIHLAPRIVRALLFIGTIAAAVTPAFLLVNLWLECFGPHGAWQANLPFDAFSLPSAILLVGLTAWPWVTLLLFHSWSRLDLRVLEVEPQLTGWRAIRYVVWPAVRPTLGLAGAVALALALNQFDIPTLLQVKVFPSEVWIRFNTFLDTWGAAAVGWPLIAVPSVLLLWLSRKKLILWPQHGRPETNERLRRVLGRPMTWSLIVASVVLVAASALGPYQSLLSTQETWTQFPSAARASAGAASHSLQFSLLAAGVSSLLAWGLWRRRIVAGAWLLWLIPGTLLAIAQAQFFSAWAPRWLYPSLGSVTLGLTLRYSVLAWFVVSSAMRAIPAAWFDTLQLCGANRWEQLRFIEWPHGRRALLASAYVVYLFALWDVETLLFLAPPGGETLSTRVFNLLHYGHVDQVNALCLYAALLALLPLALWGVFWRWNRRRPTLALLTLVVGGSTSLVGCGQSPSAAATNTSSALVSEFFSSAVVIGERGVAPGQFNKPRSLALGLDDSLFVMDMTGRLQKLATDGTFIDQWTLPDLEVGRPKGMARAVNGHILVVEPHYSRINHFDPFLKRQSQWGVMGTEVGALRLPRDIVQTADGRFWISEYGHHDRVQVFSPDRKQVELVIGSPGTADGQFSRPEGLGVDTHDRVFVADSCNHRIQVFDSNGDWIASYGEAGTGLGQMSYPYDICVDRAGFQYVCEFGGNRIQVFDPQFRPVEVIGGRGDAPGEFDQPWCVALDSEENLYIADSRNHRLQVWRRRANAPVASSTQTPMALTP